MNYKINKENYQTFSTYEANRLAPRTYFIPFSSRRELAITAPQNERYYSDKVSLLSGKWDFAYYNKVSSLPDELDTSLIEFDKISIPSTWQRTGYEPPVYINIPYPFAPKPPHFPTDCPVGVYRKQFSLSKASRHILTFLGVAGATEVYVNGQWVGYGEGSHNSQEFDITPFVKVGERNELLVVVFKWSNGTYLECQDMFRENGIFRDVYITAIADYDFKDIKITPKKTGHYWELQTAVLVYSKDEDYEVKAYLYNGEELIASGEARDNYIELANLDVEEWSAEIPKLYALYLEMEKDGVVLSVVRNMVGFKTVTIEGSVFKINNRPVKIFGVNRHDTHPTKGYAVSITDLEQDIILCKQYNCNAVRTAHYPPDPAYLQMCDIYGLYVIDEADIECHGVLKKRRGMISHNPEWEGHFVDRVKRMVVRDYNRPCVVMWSLGNEAGGWRNQDAAAKWIKKVSSLPIQYENVYGPFRFRYDVTSRMYTHPAVVEKIGMGKAGKFFDSGAPFFLCEYGHAMGVGPGSLKEYTDAFLKYDNLMGGCIWEWADHAVAGYSTKYKYTYGGDHGERIHDGNFCVDGLFYPDRTPHTGAYNLKEAYRPIRAQMLAPDVFIFKNIRVFRNTQDIRINWRLLKEGVKVDEGAFLADIAPGASIAKNITYKEADSGAEYVIRFTYTDLDGVHIMGNDEFIVQTRPLAFSMEGCEGKRMVCADKCTVEFEGGSLVFDKKLGSIASYKVSGEEILDDEYGLMPLLVRADIDNDRNLKKKWQKLGLYNMAYKLASLQEHLTPEAAVYTATISYKGKGVGKFKVVTIYEIYNSGKIRVYSGIKNKFGRTVTVPRFGNMLRLQKAYNNIEYYGRGEKENLPDFKMHSFLGKYSTTIDKLGEEYLRPQESGTHTDMRWAKLTNKKGTGIAVHACDKPFILGASHYTIKDIIASPHPEDLQESNCAIVYIDGYMSGAGSNSCGPQPMEQYKIKVGRDLLGYSFVLSPVKGQK